MTFSVFVVADIKFLLWHYYNSFMSVHVSKAIVEMDKVALLPRNIHIPLQMVSHNYQIIGLSAQGNKKPPSAPSRS